MLAMWLLLLLLAFQNPRPEPRGIPLDGVYRLNGKITVDRGEVPLVEVRLKNDTGAIVQAVQSYSNGTFHLQDVALGRYTVEVADSRFNLVTMFLWLREPAETSNEIIIKLVRNDKGGKSAGDSAEMDFSRLD